MADEPEPQEPEILDETKSQHAADMQVLISTLGQERLHLAELKVVYYLLKAGHDVNTPFTGDRFRKLKLAAEEIEKKRGVVSALQIMLAAVYEDGVVPEPSPLQVAGAKTG